MKGETGTMKTNGKNRRRHMGFYERLLYMLSNYSAHAIWSAGLLWPTAEHLYQASKFEDIEIQESIRSASSPQRAKEIARAHQHLKRPEWPKVKLEVMRRILVDKALQHPEVREALLGTGNVCLVQDSQDDSFWGWGRDHRGNNYLGRLWMEIRAELRAGKYQLFETA